MKRAQHDYRLAFLSTTGELVALDVKAATKGAAYNKACSLRPDVKQAGDNWLITETGKEEAADVALARWLSTPRMDNRDKLADKAAFRAYLMRAAEDYGLSVGLLRNLSNLLNGMDTVSSEYWED